MKNSILRLSLFFIIGISLALILMESAVLTDKRDANIKPWETETNLILIERNIHYDLIIMGTSHGRVFSRHGNHLRAERVLNKKIINLSQGYARGGLKNASIFLKYFLHRKNSADKLVYFIDPFVMYYSPDLKEFNQLFKGEPFKIRFLYLLYRYGINNNTIKNYIQATFHPHYENHLRQKDPVDKRVVKQYPYGAIHGITNNLYKNNFNQDYFNYNIELIKSFSNICKKEAIELIIASPPTIYNSDSLPGNMALKDSLRALAPEFNFKYIDYNHFNKMENFYDSDHLNSIGVVRFCNEELEKLQIIDSAKIKFKNN